MRAIEAIKLLIVQAFAQVCRHPSMRGRITISEWLYRRLRLKHLVVRKRIGAISVELDLDSQLSRFVYFEAYERAEVQLIRHYLPRGGVAVDVGAHVGYLSAVMADAVGPSGAVYAFEPHPSNFDRLAVAVASSRGVIRAHWAAVVGPSLAQTDAVPKTIRFGIDPRSEMWGSVVPEGFLPLAESISVPAVTLDAFVEQHSITRIDLIKIDVEGGERAVVQGLNQTLGRCRPIMVCELARASAGQWDGEAVIELLRPFGYRPFAIGRDARLTPIGALDPSRTVNVVFLS